MFDASATLDLIAGRFRMPLRGGHHVVLCGRYSASIVLLESEWGIVLIGPYHEVLHASCMVETGYRGMVSFYLPDDCIVACDE